LKEKIDQSIEVLLSNDRAAAKIALLALEDEVKNSTTSMTSIPKPLKFLKPHYESTIAFFNSLGEKDRVFK